MTTLCFASDTQVLFRAQSAHPSIHSDMSLAIIVQHVKLEAQIPIMDLAGLCCDTGRSAATYQI